MSDEGKPISADQIFKKMVWRHTVSISHAMEQATAWSITGVAAIVGLFISNLDSIGTIVSSVGLRWFLISFATSLIFGAISKQIGMALGKGLEIVDKMEEVLYSARIAVDEPTLYSAKGVDKRNRGPILLAPFNLHEKKRVQRH